MIPPPYPTHPHPPHPIKIKGGYRGGQRGIGGGGTDKYKLFN